MQHHVPTRSKPKPLDRSSSSGNATTWYDMRATVTATCFLNAASAAAAPLLLTTTADDGVHLWKVDPATQRTSVSRVGSRDGACPALTCCCATTRGGAAFAIGAADGSLYVGTAAGGVMTRAFVANADAAPSASTALTRVCPVLDGDTLLALSLSGAVSVVDVRVSGRCALQSNAGALPFYAATHVRTNGSSLVALAAPAGTILTFDLRRVRSFEACAAVQALDLRNQITSLCALGAAGGIAAGAVTGRVFIARAGDDDAAPVREEAVAFPSRERYPVVHIAAVDRDDGGGSSIAIAAAAADGSVAFFAKTHRSVPAAERDGAAADTWRSWQWLLRGQRPTSVSLTSVETTPTRCAIPLLAASYVSPQVPEMSRICLVSLAGDPL